MGKSFLKAAGVYFVIGILMGLTMGIIHDFRLASVHAHINLLGWVSMALFGFFYHLYPEAAKTKMSRTHFWLHHIGLPVMMLGIAAQTFGMESALGAAIAGSIAVVLGVIFFAVNLFRHVNLREASA
ncbi:hypothetical protein [Peribacillus kribbensis]|uniref:hypothetical protein n=1 Tax=Peribacillus kribbensis TaxID=356658 RepID=UPI000403C30A|nr:hypothetical protein [Peribacillus kribbensis]